MTLSRRFGATLARVEPRHWAALGASVLLHVLVALGWRPSPPPQPPVISFEIDPEPPAAADAPPQRVAAAPPAARNPLPKAKTRTRDAAREAHTLDADWRGEQASMARLPDVALPDAQALGVTAAAIPRAVYERAAAGAATPPGANDAPPTAAATTAAVAREASLAAQPAPPRLATASSVQAPTPAGRGAAPADAPVRGEAGIAGEPPADTLAARTLAPEASLSANTGPASAATPAGAGGGGHATSPDATAAQADGASPARQESLAATPLADPRREHASATGGAHLAAGDGTARAHAGAATAAPGPGARAEDASAAAAKITSGTTLVMPAATATGLLAGQAEAHRTGSTPLSASTPSAGGGSTARTATLPAASGAPHDARTASAQVFGGTPAARPELIGGIASGTTLAPSPAAGAGGRTTTGALASTAAASAQAAVPALARAGGMGASLATRGAAPGGNVSASLPGASMAAGRRADPALPGLMQATDDGARSGGTVPQARAAAAAHGAGLSLALAPGEPGGSPDTAVTLPALLATANAPSGGRAGSSGSARALAVGVADGTPATLSDTTAAGAERWVGNATGGGGARLSGNIEGGQQASGGVEAPVVLRATHAVTVQAMRPDSEIERLDVLAPASFCPLPGFFPDNRPMAGAPAHADDRLPSYGDNNPNFHYPLRAWAFNHEGRVTLRVEVLRDGRPGQILLKQSSGSGILDQDAREQIARWRFVPARRAGQAVTAWIDVPVVYRLRDGR